MAIRPFQPPSTSQELLGQTQNLWRQLNRLQSIPQLDSSAALSDVISTLNSLLTRLSEITQGGDVTRRS